MILKGGTEYDNIIQVGYTDSVSQVSQQFSLKRWNVTGARERPNGIRTHSYKPQEVMKAVKGWLSELINPWW